MRVLVAPQEFKGTLTARQAANAIAAGLRTALPAAEIETLPLADGGPGTVDVLVSATRGEVRRSEVRDPLGRPVMARWGVLGTEPVAVIEMAEASGLLRLTHAERDPAIASTSGTGDLLRIVLDMHFDRILVGMGGSATNDGGAGLAQALGVRLLDGSGEELPPGGAALARLDHIDTRNIHSGLADAEVVAMTDVMNPLCGPEGASLVYGPQKGADSALAQQLDDALRHYGEVIERDLGVNVLHLPGAGAAGGLGAGLVAFCGATIQSGFDVVAEATGLAGRIAAMDAVVTGEGRLDSQSAFGKTSAGVARSARDAGKPVLALAGSVEPGDHSDFDGVLAVVPDVASDDAAMSEPAGHLERLGATKAADWIEANLS